MRHFSFRDLQPETSGAPSGGESVVRPDPGLARGRWEAPGWAFWVTFAAAVLGGLAWAALALRARRGAR